MSTLSGVHVGVNVGISSMLGGYFVWFFYRGGGGGFGFCFFLKFLFVHHFGFSFFLKNKTPQVLPLQRNTYIKTVLLFYNTSTNFLGFKVLFLHA